MRRRRVRWNRLLSVTSWTLRKRGIWRRPEVVILAQEVIEVGDFLLRENDIRHPAHGGDVSSSDRLAGAQQMLELGGLIRGKDGKGRASFQRVPAEM